MIWGVVLDGDVVFDGDVVRCGFVVGYRASACWVADSL